MSRLNYREIAPPPDLAGEVECFWTSSGDGLSRNSQKHRVLPDGCMDILLAGESRGGGKFRANSLSLVGTMTKFMDYVLPENPFFFAVRFKPAGASWFLPFPASEVTDKTVTLRDVWGRSAEKLNEQLADAQTVEKCRHLFAVELRDQMKRHAKPAVPAARHAIGSIVAAGGQVPLGRLTPSLAASSRQLRRLVREHSGIGPKQLCRVIRFQRLLRLISGAAKPDWVLLALETGFYDQAHMINQFRELSGLTPEQYYLAQSAGRAAESGATGAQSS